MGWFGKGGGGVVGSAFGLVLLLYSYLSFPPVVDAAGSYVQCVQFGQNSPYGPWSIGGKNFEPRDRNAYRYFYVEKNSSRVLPFRDVRKNPLTCPAGWEFRSEEVIRTMPKFFPFLIDYCPTDVQIRPYLVEQNGRVLNGWLHIEVEYTGNEGKDDGIDWIYVQVVDEAFNAIGQFVSDPEEQCTTERKDLLTPTQYQYLPCSAVGKREAKASQGVFAASRNQYQGVDPQKYLGAKDLKKGIQFTWRLNEFWCNRHQRFRIDAYLWTSQRSKYFRASGGEQDLCRDYSYVNGGECRTRRKSTGWMYHKWIGAADIKIPGKLTCGTRAFVRDFKPTPEALAAWFYKGKELTYGDDYLTEDPDKNSNKTLFKKTCQVNPMPTDSTEDERAIRKVVSFGGRCKEHFEKIVSREFLPGCVTDINSATPGFEKEGFDFSKFSKYTEYREHVVATRKQMCEQVCIYPTATDVPDIKKFKSDIQNLTLRKPPVSIETVRTTRVRDRAETSWQTRKYHGNLLIFVTMFVIPVSIFFVRYFKETCMNQMAGGCAYWYWFHLLMSCVVPTLYYSGHASMHVNIANFGKSLDPNATAHRIIGHIFIWLYMAMVALGAIRPAPRRALLICNTLHSIVGFLLYFMCIFLAINSTFIPQSPTLHDCDKETGLPIGYSFTARMVSGWFCFDMLCHILLTVAQVVIDRREKIKRSGFGLPFMPMLPGDHPHDLVGHRFRKLIFAIYVIVSVIFTLVLITVLFNRDEYPEYCVLGEMTCNLSEYRPYQNSSPFGCEKTSLEYYNKVYEKYEINLTQIMSSLGG